MGLRERLGKEWLFCDGGTGSILHGMGLKGGELPELWNLNRPDDIVALNRAYFEAGSNIVNTNTFGANSYKFDNVSEIVAAAVKLCQRARKEAGREDDAYVAIDVGPTGKLLEPMGDLAFNDAVKIFAEIIKAGYEAGGDLVVIETMSDLLETKASLLAAKEHTDLPVLVTMTFTENGRTFTGCPISAAAPSRRPANAASVSAAPTSTSTGTSTTSTTSNGSSNPCPTRPASGHCVVS